jgi:hypothetical protein
MIVWSLVLERLNMGNYDNYYNDLYDMLKFLYKDKKLSISQITELTGGECSTCSLRAKLEEFGIKRRGKGGPHHVKPFTVSKEEYKTSTYKELALKYGVHRTTIRNRCLKYIKTNGKRRKIRD